MLYSNTIEDILLLLSFFRREGILYIEIGRRQEKEKEEGEWMDGWFLVFIIVMNIYAS